jgi:hypothetical protein
LNEANYNGELHAADVMEVDTSKKPSMLNEGCCIMPSYKHQTNATSVAAAAAAVAAADNAWKDSWGESFSDSDLYDGDWRYSSFHLHLG